MLAEAAEKTVPSLEENGEWIHLKDRVVPFVTFYLIHETTNRLLGLLECCPAKSQNTKETISRLLLSQDSFLGGLLPGVSSEAMTEWMYCSMSIKCYVLAAYEEDRLKATERLLKIQRILSFDDFIGMRQGSKVSTEHSSCLAVLR